MSKRNVQKINDIISAAAKAASRTQSSYVTVEHLLYALADDKEVSEIMREFDLDTNNLKDLELITKLCFFYLSREENTRILTLL